MTGDSTRRPDLDDTQALEEELEPEERPAAPAGRRPGGPPPARGRTRGLAVDPSLRIRDRASAAFVIGTILVFLGIFVYALTYGRGGAFTPEPTPIPAVSASPSASGSPVPSGSLVPSGSPVPSGAPSASPATSVTPPSTLPSAGPSSATNPPPS